MSSNRLRVFAGLFGLAVSTLSLGCFDADEPPPTKSKSVADEHEGWSPTAIQAEKHYYEQQAKAQNWGKRATGGERPPLKWTLILPDPTQIKGSLSFAGTASSGSFDNRPRKRIVPDGLPVATEAEIAELKRFPIVDIDGLTTKGDYVVGGVIVPVDLLPATTLRGPCW